MLKKSSSKTLIKSISCILCAGIITGTFCCNIAKAATPTDIFEQKQKNQQIEKDRENKNQQEDVFLQKKKALIDKDKLPQEEKSFQVNNIVLAGEKLDRFQWLQTQIKKYENQKIGKEGINIILKNAENELINRGFVTTRLVIPEQNLSGGTLKFLIIPGIIGDIKFTEETDGRWSNAFTIKHGDILNIRDLEQGLEQMKRVASQDVDIKIEPGAKAGESNILLTLKKTNPLRLDLSFDDSGSEKSGKMQMSTTLSIDNLTKNNDLFYATYTTDIDGKEDEKGTHGKNFYYSIPFGYYTVSLMTSKNKYHQSVAGTNQNFIYSGISNNQELRIEKIINRNQVSKTGLKYRLIKRESRSFLEDAEFINQRKETTASEIGINHRHYYGKTVLDTELSYKWAVPWLGAKLGETTSSQDPTNKYRMWIFDTNLTTPLKLGKIMGRYSMNIRGQYTNNVLYNIDQFSIGNRYTVRGFDGEQNLSAENGFYIRNEISIPAEPGHEMYIGLDYGKVSGPSAKYLLGKELIGAVLGFRGSLGHATYDVFTGWPIKKPEGFTTASNTLGFRINFEY